MPRPQAVVSVFDAGFVLGDGIWVGLRVVGGHPAFLDQHLDRLWEGAAALALDVGLTRDELTTRIYDTWPAGPRASDGVWAPYWYDAVLRSTGFAPYRPRRAELTPEGEAVVAATRPAAVRRPAGALSLCSVSRATAVDPSDEAGAERVHRTDDLHVDLGAAHDVARYEHPVVGARDLEHIAASGGETVCDVGVPG